MDLNSAEDSGTVRFGFGLALVIICLGIGFHYALNRSLTTVSDSMTGGFMVIDHVDSILDDLNRLSVNQRAFLGTGDEHFSQDVVESVMEIESNMDALREVARRGERLRDPIGKLGRSIDWVLDLLGKTYEIEQANGPAVAIALLDADESLDQAKMLAQDLRRQATEGVYDRVRTQRNLRTVLEVLF